MNAPRFFLGRVVLTSVLVFTSWVAAAQTPPADAGTPRGAVASAEYRLAPGDQVRISVFQNPDLSVETRLTEAGTIGFPLIGTISLRGLTTSQAERRIADALRDGNFVKQPQVSVLVSEVRGNQVSVLGQVGRPGRYPIETGELRLTDLLATAGGISAGGSDIVTVVGTRNGKPYRVEVDLPRVFGPDRRNEDVLLQNDDVVWVDRAPSIFIYGEVQRPGAHRLERGLTVLQTLATAGGLTARGTEKGIRLHRRTPDGKVQVLQPSMDDSMRDGDVLYVRESLF